MFPKKVKLNGMYTRQQLLDAMLQRSWSAGVPSMQKVSGLLNCIAFPALDRNTQIQISIGGFDDNKNPVKFCQVAIGRVCTTNYGETLAQSALNGIGGGMFGRISLLASGDAKRRAKEQVKQLISELRDSGL